MFDPLSKILGRKISNDRSSKNKNEEVVWYKASIPKCDICGEYAEYDGKTKDGPWAYMCHKCMSQHGVGLGLGKGQRLILRK